MWQYLQNAYGNISLLNVMLLCIQPNRATDNDALLNEIRLLFCIK